MAKPLLSKTQLLSSFFTFLLSLSLSVLMAGNTLEEAHPNTRPDGNDGANDLEVVDVPAFLMSSFTITGTVYNPFGMENADNDWWRIPVGSNMNITPTYASPNYVIYIQEWLDAGRTMNNGNTLLLSGNSKSLYSNKYYTIVVFQSGSAGNTYNYSVDFSTSPFPVVWSALDLRAFEDGVDVMWETAQEINNDYFEVLRSMDGERWVSLGTVSGAGNSDEAKAYEFRDAFPIAGVNHYQIKQVDYNGATSLSQVVSVEFGAKYADDGPFFHPNPCRGTLTIAPGYKAVSLYSMNGRQVFYKTISGGGETLTFTKIPKGLYLIMAWSGEGRPRMDRLMIEY